MTATDPVFVAGLERSGTSLMYALLASHPNIAMTRRTNLWKHFYDQYGDLAEPANLDRCLDTMRRYKRTRKLEPDLERLRRDFLAGETSYARLFALLEGQYAERLGKPRWGDKSLDQEQWADQIFAAYPGARILHMIRDPRDRFASSLTRWQTRRGGVGAGTAEWLHSARLALHNVQRHPDRYRVVRYETLAAEPERELHDVFAFIGEEYRPEVLAMDGAPVFRDKGSNSSYGSREVGVISTDSIGRYRTVLSARQIASIQLLASDEMTRFDYEVEPQHLSFGERVRFGGLDLPFDVARLVAWRTREAVRNRRGRPVPAYRLVDEARAA